MAASAQLWLSLSILVGIAITVIIASGIRIIRPYQKGLVERLGSYIGIMDPGFHLIFPIITRIIFMDMRLQSLNVPRHKVRTKDLSITDVDMIINIQVVDPYKAYYNVQNYREASTRLAQQVLAKVASDEVMEDLMFNQNKINSEIREELNSSTLDWGISIESVEIRNVDVLRQPKTEFEDRVMVRKEELKGNEVIG
jgi:regulator of protease activity HflC (stomatin/prohibitin superfamily)